LNPFIAKEIRKGQISSHIRDVLQRDDFFGDENLEKIEYVVAYFSEHFIEKSSEEVNEFLQNLPPKIEKLKELEVFGDQSVLEGVADLKDLSVNLFSFAFFEMDEDTDYLLLAFKDVYKRGKDNIKYFLHFAREYALAYEDFGSDLSPEHVLELLQNVDDQSLDLRISSLRDIVFNRHNPRQQAILNRLGINWNVKYYEDTDFRDLLDSLPLDSSLFDVLKDISLSKEDYSDLTWEERNQLMRVFAHRIFGDLLWSNGDEDSTQNRAKMWRAVREKPRGQSVSEFYKELGPDGQIQFDNESTNQYLDALDKALLMPELYRNITPIVPTKVGIEIEFKPRDETNNEEYKVFLFLCNHIGLKKGSDFPEIAPGPFNNIYDLLDFMRNFYASGVTDPYQYGESIHHNLGYNNGSLAYPLYLLTMLSGYASLPKIETGNLLRFFQNENKNGKYIENKGLRMYSEPLMYALLEQTYWIAVSVNALFDSQNLNYNLPSSTLSSYGFERNLSLDQLLRFKGSLLDDNPVNRLADTAINYLILFQEGLALWGLTDFRYVTNQPAELSKLYRQLYQILPGYEAMVRNDVSSVELNPQEIDGMQFNNVVEFVRWVMQSWAQDVIDIHLENLEN